MKTVGIIPARYNSSRIINKPLIKINNKTLIQCTYEAVIDAKIFDSVYLTTDSKKIQRVAESFGGQCIITSKKHRNGTERCAQVIKSIGDIDAEDLIVNIQCDEPYLKKIHFKKILSLFEKNVEIGTLICPLNDDEIKDSSVVKVKINNENCAKYFKRKVIKENKLYKHIGVYAYKTKTLQQICQLPVLEKEINQSLEQLRWLLSGYKIYCALIKDNLTSINTYKDIKKITKKSL